MLISPGRVTGFLIKRLLLRKLLVRESGPKCFAVHEFKEKNVWFDVTMKFAQAYRTSITDNRKTINME